MAAENLDNFIESLWALKPRLPGVRGQITEADVSFLCSRTTDIFLRQPVLLELRPPIVVVGDTHGQFHDTLRIFESGRGKPGDAQFLFLGDYVDRGRNSIENLCLLLAYKIKYPTTFYMLRGNHECSYINRIYGFWEDCVKAWPYTGTEQWKLFSGVFNCLPIAAIIEHKIFCVHGGLSPHLHSLDDIRRLERPLEVPEDGLLCDLVWSDPDADLDDWGSNERGTSVCFGQPQVEQFLSQFQFDLVCRAHQAVMDGFEFPFRPDQSLITLFSAPNYCYEFDNKGAILHVDERLFCSFTQLDARTYPLEEPELPERPGTPPRAGGYGEPPQVALVPPSVQPAPPAEDDDDTEEEGGSGSDAEDEEPHPEEPAPAESETQQTAAESPAETLPKALPETVPEALPEALPETLPEVLPEALPETLPEALPETLPETLPDTEE
jgi:serine/threonine-protein phosphatase PP1 catalytic subunit